MRIPLMRIAVIGAGKMGLPLACRFADRGEIIMACDIKPALVIAINAGRCPIDEPGVPELLTRAVGEGRLRATTETAAAVSESDVAVVQALRDCPTRMAVRTVKQNVSQRRSR
jgi:UDP-N-acetyl-D-mannosaminuronate dehydrogenase